jgi:hypothetical protein
MITKKALCPEWQTSALDALSRLARLGDNWDGYGSPPLRPAALATAHQLVRTLEQLPLPVPHVCPVSGGGINLTWQQATRELGIEILPDGSAQYLTVMTEPVTGQEETHEERLPLDRPDHVRTLAAWVISP